MLRGVQSWRSWRWALLWGVVLTLAMPVSASDLGDDAWLWADPDDLFSFDEDALFGSGGLLTESPEGSSSALEEVFLVSDGIDFGGTYNLSLQSQWGWTPDEGGPAGGRSESRIDLNGSVFFDARPNRHFRAFGKVKGDVSLTDSPLDPNLRLHELFVDFDIGDRAFFRVGKQTINWGVGYFFSPADIVNVGRIDPENPELEREGPVALRLNLPWNRNNLYAYAIVDGKAGDYRLALAPKAEYVVGGSEVGVGLYYRADRVPRAMVTLSTSVGRLSLFGEAVMSKGSDKRFVEEAAVTLENPFGLKVVTDQESLRVHATAGTRVSYSDPDGRFSVTGAGQYYYNGEGYDGEFSKANRMGMMYLLKDGQLALTDLISTGRHYAALSVSGTSRSFKDIVPSAFWLGNLSDGSGMVSLSMSYTGWKDVRASLGISRTYGEAGSEYDMLSPGTKLTVGVTIGGRR